MNDNVQLAIKPIKKEEISNIGQNKKISIFTLGCKVNQYEQLGSSLGTRIEYLVKFLYYIIAITIYILSFSKTEENDTIV